MFETPLLSLDIFQMLLARNLQLKRKLKRGIGWLHICGCNLIALWHPIIAFLSISARVIFNSGSSMSYAELLSRARYHLRCACLQCHLWSTETRTHSKCYVCCYETIPRDRSYNSYHTFCYYYHAQIHVHMLSTIIALLQPATYSETVGEITALFSVPASHTFSCRVQLQWTDSGWSAKHAAKAYRAWFSYTAKRILSSVKNWLRTDRSHA